MVLSNPWQIISDESVSRDAEFDRIAALPRRVVSGVDTPKLSAFMRAPGSTASLRQKQAELLFDLYSVRGAVGALPTGKGKTLPSFSAAMLPHPQDPTRPWVERPLLIVPGGLMGKTAGPDYDVFDRPNAIGGDWGKYRRDWRLHTNQKVISYQLMQTPTQTRLLWKLMPDLIVCDEAQELRNRKNSRCQRLENYLRDYPWTIVVMLSASFFKRQLKDAAHLYWYALKERSPLPRPGSTTLDEWGKAVDLKTKTRIRAGALHSFCGRNADGTEETVLQGLKRRMAESPGFVVDFTSSSDSALNIYGVNPVTIPKTVLDAFRLMRAHGQTPAGDELTDRFNIWRRSKEIAYGFYYRWVWPDNVPDIEWLTARADWRRFVRHVLKYNGRGLDTEATVRAAVDQGLYGQVGQGPMDGPGSFGALKLAEWRRLRPRYAPNFHPPRATEWLSDYIAKACAEWLHEDTGKGRLCWVEHNALGHAIAKIAGVPYFGEGDDGVERFKGPCVVSIWSNSKGRNLQDRYSENFFACAPPGGDIWEQALSRTHRDGQEEDEVSAWVPLHCRELWECFEQARADARHQEELTGQEQKLNIATVSVLTEQTYSRLVTSQDPLWMENAKKS